MENRLRELLGLAPRAAWRPYLMGVVNATPDSFSDSPGAKTVADRVDLARELIADGADIIDVGGESGVTNKPAVDAQLEIERVVPVITEIAKLPGAVVSVDTYKPAVARAAIAAGARIVNDVSGLADDDLAAAAAEGKAAIVLMHTRARPKQKLFPHYDDVVADIKTFLSDAIVRATAQGVPLEHIVLDPGPDFAKTPAQTVETLRSLDELRTLGRPLLLAVSRKDFIGALTDRGPREREAGTLAALGAGADHGVSFVRVHDVAAADDFLTVRAALNGQLDIDPALALAENKRRIEGTEQPMSNAGDSFKIAHISDLHCGSSYFVPELLQNAIEEINEQEPEMTIVSGDLTNEGYLPEFELAQDYLDRLHCEHLVIVPGNHDARNVGYEHFEDVFGSRNSDLYTDHLAVVAVDSSEPDLDYGTVGRGQYKWIEGCFDREAALKIFVLHHHLLPVPGTGRERNVVHDAGDTLECLNRSGVNLVLSGHKHVPYAWRFESSFVVTTGTVSTMRVRGRTRPCYLMIEGDAEHVAITRHYPGVGSDLLLRFNPRTLEYNKSDEIIAGHRSTPEK